jgi:hypothetical protein
MSVLIVRHSLWRGDVRLAIVFFHPAVLPLGKNRSKKPGQRFGFFAILRL